MTLHTELDTNHSFGEIIGKSQKMQQVFTQIRAAAAGTITVLIQGETGTGESAILYETTDMLQRQNLPLHLTQENSPVPIGGSMDTTDILTLKETERIAIIQALKTTDGNISDAAQALGIGRNTLYRKMKEHNLQR